MRASCSSMFLEGILPPHGGRHILLTPLEIFPDCLLALSLRLSSGTVSGLCESRGAARTQRVSHGRYCRLPPHSPAFPPLSVLSVSCQHSALYIPFSKSVTGHDSCLWRGSSSLKRELVCAPSSVSPMTVAPGSRTALEQRLMREHMFVC